MHIYKDPPELFKEVRRSLAQKRFKKICTSLEVIIEEHEDATFQEWLNIYRSYVLLVLAKVKSIVTIPRVSHDPSRSPKHKSPFMINFCKTIIKRAEQRFLVYSQLFYHIFQQTAPEFVDLKIIQNAMIQDPASTYVPGLEKIDKEKIKIIKAKTKVLEPSEFNINLHTKYYYKLALNFIFSLVCLKRTELKHWECSRMLNTAAIFMNSLQGSNEYTLRIRLLMNLKKTIEIQSKTYQQQQSEDSFPFRQLQIINDLLQRKKTKKAHKYLNAIHNYIVLTILQAEDKMNFNKAFQYMDIGMHLYEIYKYIPRRIHWFYRDVRNRFYDTISGQAEICLIVSMVFGTLNKAELTMVEKYDRYIDEKNKEIIHFKEIEKLKKQRPSLKLNQQVEGIHHSPLKSKFKELSVVKQIDSRRFNDNQKISSGSEIVTEEIIQLPEPQKKTLYTHSGISSFNRLILHRPLLLEKLCEQDQSRQAFKKSELKFKSTSFKFPSYKKKRSKENALKIIKHSEKIVKLVRKESQSLKIVSQGTKARNILSRIQPITAELQHPEKSEELLTRPLNLANNSSVIRKIRLIENRQNSELVTFEEKQQSGNKIQNTFLKKFRSLSHNILMSSVNRTVRPQF